MRRHKRIEARFDEADSQRDAFKAAALQAEQHGVSWAVHDLDYIVEDLRGKQKTTNQRKKQMKI